MSNINEWVVLASAIAAIVSPIVALLGVGLGYVLHSKHELRQRALARKDDVFATLMAYRYNAGHPEFIKALNMVPVAFKDDPRIVSEVRDLRKFLMAGPSEEEDKRREVGKVLLAMAGGLGYKDIEYADVTEAFRTRPG